MSWASYSTHEDKSAAKIQGAFRMHQARSKLREQAAWKTNEKLEYASEQAEAKLGELFDALLNASDSLPPGITKALEKLRSPASENELFRSADTHIDSNYQGPRLDGPITHKDFVNLMARFQRGQILHEKYVNKILHEARTVLKTLSNCNQINLSELGRVTVVGDLHGQLSDLTHIFDQNGLPSAHNAFLFNGDFVDRGKNSTEVFLLLLVALILNPTCVFLNRGNHEDMALNKNFTFQSEVTKKYPKSYNDLLKSFSNVFNWLPLYSIIDTGVHRIIVMHGGISNRIHLSKLQSLPRYQYLSLVFKPQSRFGKSQLTPEEIDEFHQIQDLLWSDPDPNRNASGCRENVDRGTAYLFAADITQYFLQKYNLSMIIRSHQVKQEGYEYRHGGKVLTIFSASNYDGHHNNGAVIRWELNNPDPKIIQHNVHSNEMRNETVDYHELFKIIAANRTSLMDDFRAGDKQGNGHVSLRRWEFVMTNVLRMSLPWLTLRSKLVHEDSEGVLYETMFQRYSLNNSRIQLVCSISRQEFAAVIRVLMKNQRIHQADLNNYVDELTNAMDADGNGRIDFDEFFNGFQLICAK